jgi:hypothetical protein
VSKGRPQRLRIIFALEPHLGGEMSLGSSVVRPIIKSAGVDHGIILEKVAAVLQRFGSSLEFERRDGPALSLDCLQREIKNKGRFGPGVEAAGLSFQVGDVPSMSQSFVLIEEKLPGAAKLWDEWVQPFLDETRFVQAWVADADYEHWQNADDLAEFRAAGRDASYLATRSNGLPAPLEREVIDTSGNPSRWTMRKGYVEAIGSLMWLGDRFWDAIGKRREDAVRSLGWVHISAVTRKVVKIASDIQFTDETTATAQNQLRAILYGNPANPTTA